MSFVVLWCQLGFYGVSWVKLVATPVATQNSESLAQRRNLSTFTVNSHTVV